MRRKPKHGPSAEGRLRVQQLERSRSAILQIGMMIVRPKRQAREMARSLHAIEAPYSELYSGLRLDAGSERMLHEFHFGREICGFNQVGVGVAPC